MNLLFVYLFCFFICTKQQYQQCTHISGSSRAFQKAVFDRKGYYSKENSPGGLEKASSVLISNDTEILIFFGNAESPEKYSDRVWKYSINKNQWMFLKGREENDQPPVFSEYKTFDKESQIGSRNGGKVWKYNEELIYIFGGFGYVIDENEGSSRRYQNDLWIYNISTNSYSVLFNTIYKTEVESNLYGDYIILGQFNLTNRPGARYLHETIPFNEEEVFMFGGYGCFSVNWMGVSYMGDYWIYSTTKGMWKYMGGSLNSYYEEVYYTEKNVYHPSNNFGSKMGTVGTKINNEEILTFGGVRRDSSGTFSYTNYVQKYNTTSNMWMYIAGKNDGNFQDYKENIVNLREYDDINLPGGRYGHLLIKINEEEVIVFGGSGFGYTGRGSIRDLWIFNFKHNQWKFIGKDVSKYNAGMAVTTQDYSYSENTLMGSMTEIIGEYRENESNDGELYIAFGNGNSAFEQGLLDDVWKIYFGKMCHLLQHDNPAVCSGKGSCVDHNICECQKGFYGSNCDITMCAGVLSNETDVCSQNGVCSNGICLCFAQSAYDNPDCTVNEELKMIMENLWIVISVPVIVAIAILIFICIFISGIVLTTKLCKMRKKIDGIEDVDLILNEAKIEQSAVKAGKAKIEIDKSLFEVNYKDIELKSLLGEGGSQSTIYLAEWKGNKCAYKGFDTQSFGTSTDTDYSEFEKEVKIYSNIRHPSILQFYGACLNPPKIGILLQFCKNGDLCAFLGKFRIKKKRKYAPKEKIRLLKEIATGMDYLHSINLLHRDLKPENVLVDDNEHAKIMDFGLSKLSSNNEKTMTQQIGTSYYMAPEVFKGGRYSNKCDVYSFAILMYVLITEKFSPYGENSGSSIINKVALSNYRPNIETKDFKDFKGLIPMIKKNWSNDPDERNTFTQIIEKIKAEENRMTREMSVKPKKSLEVELRKKNKELLRIVKQQKQEIMKLKQLKKGKI